MLIKIKALSKAYTMDEVAQPVLNNINLTIAKGEMVALMGESGSGKSTLMNLIGLLDKPTSGQYYLNDQDVSMLNDDQMAVIRNKTIGFVFQQFFLLDKLTARQNVELPLLYLGMDKKERLEKVEEILIRVGMENRMHHRPTQLSGGQQQRVALARALVCRPKLILADEPTGALDSKTANDVMELFQDLHRDFNTTLIIVTHSTSVGNACARKITLSDGVIISNSDVKSGVDD